MSEVSLHKQMISTVAKALGDELLARVAFVGGCTTALLITDEYTRDQVRHTNDVDLIVQVIGFAEWHQLQKQLRVRGFKDLIGKDAPICSLTLGELRVDFMPQDRALLGFSNVWYADALETARPYRLDSEIEIRLVTPPYFLATKLEAYKGRGNNDPLASQDIEDILNVVSGRASLASEIAQSTKDVRDYLSNEFGPLMQHPGMFHAIEGCAQDQPGVADLIRERIGMIVKQSC